MNLLMGAILWFSTVACAVVLALMLLALFAGAMTLRRHDADRDK